MQELHRNYLKDNVNEVLKKKQTFNTFLLKIEK